MKTLFLIFISFAIQASANDGGGYYIDATKIKVLRPEDPKTNPVHIELQGPDLKKLMEVLPPTMFAMNPKHGETYRELSIVDEKQARLLTISCNNGEYKMDDTDDTALPVPYPNGNVKCAINLNLYPEYVNPAPGAETIYDVLGDSTHWEGFICKERAPITDTQYSPL